MKHYKLIFSFIVLFSIFTACEKDLLEKYPLDEISSADFFKQKADLEIYMNRFYYDDVLVPNYWNYNISRRGIFTYDIVSDNEITGTAIDMRLNGSRVVPTSGGGWDYTYVRKINYFFDNYRKCKDDFESYKQYVGEAHFFRALIYLQLMEKFGDVVWLDKVVGTDSEVLYAPRTPRNIVADNIIADLDSAALYLPEDRTEGGTRLDKWAALALQSRIALYEGTWEKYHAGTNFGVSGSSPENFLNKAVQASQAIMNSGKFQIYSTGNPNQDYYDLFVQPDYSSSKEIIFWKKYDKTLEITNLRNSEGQYPKNQSVTKGLADAFLCTDGKPISVSNLFDGYDLLANEAKNRDPRFTQTIFTPDAVWTVTGTSTQNWDVVYNRLNFNSTYYAPTGYALRKGYNSNTAYHDLAGESNPLYYFRYAEVLLNYAEAKAELGAITQADIDKSIKLLRDRVGMPNLTLSNITTDPNWDFPSLSPTINEIRRERRVELGCEGLRWNDIARWAAADELIVGKRPKGMMQDQLQYKAYPVDENGFMDPFKAGLSSGYGFNVNRDYLDPLPSNQLVLNPDLGQNPGW